eukprot:CAMPEP_0116877872 /NCGR_PEP_ID=MMETSP0463-20121206/9616_1 /TAXON_ID=181622 /ORGANISM="Strombidinopsis sp, Strain SopsisLIS2011" /LENGTH=81 /DNA_ID=CAMNT_0004525515 /DNA_START=114 /DNA_END=359 /DNA_ORIENTATION=+
METIVSENTPSIKVEVYLNYQGKVQLAHTYVHAYNQEEADSEDFLYDNKEEKTGFQQACKQINDIIGPFLKGKELPLTKKI